MINIKDTQVVMRYYQKKNNLTTGSPLKIESLIKEGLIGRFPSCPDGQSYICDQIVPDNGTLYLRCLNPDHMNFEHKE